MRAWVQNVPESSVIWLNLVQSAHWFRLRGYEVARFEHADIAAGRLDDDLLRRPEVMVVRGGVDTVRAALVRAGRPEPPNIDLPEQLSPWFGRMVGAATLGEVRARVESADFEPCHVKPRYHHKLFTGLVVRAFRDLIATAALPDDVPVLVQGCVEFRSEWRVSVLRDRILHAGYYRGDPLAFPDPNVLRAALEAYTDRPIAFAMDWGVTTSGATILVEVNDGYSLGNYGLGGACYTAMVEARWRELMGLADNGVGKVLHDNY